MSARFDIDLLAQQYDDTVGKVVKQWVTGEELIDKAFIDNQRMHCEEVADYDTLVELRRVLGPPDSRFLVASVNSTNYGFCYLKWFPIEYWPYLSGQLLARPNASRLNLALEVFGIDDPRVKRLPDSGVENLVHALPLGTLEGVKVVELDATVQVGANHVRDTSHTGHGSTFYADGYGRAMVSGCDGKCSILSECAFVHVRDHCLRGCIKHGLPTASLDRGGLKYEDRQHARRVARYVTGETRECPDYKGIPAAKYRECAYNCVYPFLNALSRGRVLAREMDNDVWDSDEEWFDWSLIESDVRRSKMIIHRNPPDFLEELRGKVDQIGEGRYVRLRPGEVPPGVAGKKYTPVYYDRFGLREIFSDYAGEVTVAGRLWDVGNLAMLFDCVPSYVGTQEFPGFDPAMRVGLAEQGKTILYRYLTSKLKVPESKDWPEGEELYCAVVSAVLVNSEFSVLVRDRMDYYENVRTFNVLIKNLYSVGGMAAVANAVDKFGLIDEFAGRVAW